MCSGKLLSCQVLLAITYFSSYVACNPVLNNFNNNIRDYSVKEEALNSTYVRTLQKDEAGRYANFAPVQNPIRLKDIPDNALSGSSYTRGLLHQEQLGYGLHGYEETPHYGYGYDYEGDHDHNFDLHIGHHGGYHGHHDGHHNAHHGGHHHGYGHHHKHFNHALAAKHVLWPIAGIALLGAAAAALVTNPVLLQLGVVSGKRRRRDTEEDDRDFRLQSLTKWAPDKLKNQGDQNQRRVDVLEGSKDPNKVGRIADFQRKTLKRKFNGKQKALLKKAYPTVQSSIEQVTLDAPEKYNSYSDEDRFVPVPIKVKYS